MIEQSEITCPLCSHQALEQMPLNACQYFYDCKGCGELLKAKPGDCCVFCSLLATPKQSMGELELHRQLALSVKLLSRFRYSESVTLPDMPPRDIVDHGEKLNVIKRTAHPLGDVVSMSEHEAVLMTYFRNNVQHLFAIPASIACCFIQGRRLEHSELQLDPGQYPGAVLDQQRNGEVEALQHGHHRLAHHQ